MLPVEFDELWLQDKNWGNVFLSFSQSVILSKIKVKFSSILRRLQRIYLFSFILGQKFIIYIKKLKNKIYFVNIWLIWRIWTKIPKKWNWEIELNPLKWPEPNQTWFLKIFKWVLNFKHIKPKKPNLKPNWTENRMGIQSTQIIN